MKKLRLWVLLLPFVLYYLGAGLNLLVITVNDGAMPVVMPFSSQCADAPRDVDFLGMKIHVPVSLRDCKPGETLDHVHRVAIESDHLKWLEDWIQVPGLGICSPGDCFLWLGDFLTYPLVAAWFALLLVGAKQN